MSEQYARNVNQKSIARRATAVHDQRVVIALHSDVGGSRHMTFRRDTGFCCDGCSLPMREPFTSLEFNDGDVRDLCSDCGVIVVDAIDFMMKVVVVESFADDPDEIGAEVVEFDVDQRVDERREAS